MDCHAQDFEEAALFVENCMKDMIYRPCFQVIDTQKNIKEVNLNNNKYNKKV